MRTATIKATIQTPRGTNIGENIKNTLSKTYNLTKVTYRALHTVRQPELKVNTTFIELTFD